MVSRTKTVLSRVGQSGFIAILVLVIALLHGGMAARSSARPLVQSVGPIEMTVSDMDRATRFYSSVLSFEKVADRTVRDPNYLRLEGVLGESARIVRMRLGNEYIELTQFQGTENRPIPSNSRSNDRWFQHIAIVVSDMRRAYEKLHDAHVEQISLGPQRLPDWNVNAAGIDAFYFNDPDRHPLEIIHYPPDKGQAKWHNPSDRLFLGIDHTAIAIGDTNVSLRFYRDLFGFRAAGASDNSGIEQGTPIRSSRRSGPYHQPAIKIWSWNRTPGIPVSQKRTCHSTRRASHRFDSSRDNSFDRKLKSYCSGVAEISCSICLARLRGFQWRRFGLSRGHSCA